MRLTWNSRHFTKSGNRDTVPMEEMRKPTMLHQNGDHCITVLKRGRTTSVTVGKVLKTIAYVSKYFTEHNITMSKQLVVIPLDQNPPPFLPKEIPALSWSMARAALRVSSPAVAGPPTLMT